MFAAYFFRFYGRDQSISVGFNEKLLFYGQPLIDIYDGFNMMPTMVQLVFYNDLIGNEDNKLIRANGVIKTIGHPELPSVKKIICRSFSSTIETNEGEILVDAEEEAGEIISGHAPVTGWLFTVDIDITEVEVLTMEQIVDDILEDRR